MGATEYVDDALERHKRVITRRVVPSVGMGVFRFSKDAGGHFVLAGGLLVLVCAKGDVGAATRRTQHPAMDNTVIQLIGYLGTLNVGLKNDLFLAGLTEVQCSKLLNTKLIIPPLTLLASQSHQ